MTSEKKRLVKDIFDLALLVLIVIMGSWVINFAFFRSFNVYGPSMEPTLYTNDRIIVNRLPVTWAGLTRGEYKPQRGEVIVFENPHHITGGGDEYIVKRVIAFPGERVVVAKGVASVYTDGTHNSKTRIDPYAGTDAPDTPVDDDVDEIVPPGEIFVIGDNHNGNYSQDSRNGLGTIPYSDIIGPVSMRIFPVTKFRLF